MKKKTQILSLKSLKIDKAYIMTLSNAIDQVKGGIRGTNPVLDPSVINPTDDTIGHSLEITCAGCPPVKTKPPFCIF